MDETINGARIKALASETDRVPSEVMTAYTPSGKSAPLSFPKMLVAGAVGIILGLGLAYLVRGVSHFVFGVFDDAGACLNIVYYPAVFAYYLCPLAIPIMAGAGMAQGAKWGRSRSLKDGTVASVAVGLAAAVLVVWMEMMLVRRALDVIVLPESLWLLLLVPVIWVMTTWFAWVVALGLGAISVALVRHLVVDSMVTDKFCERCEQYLNSSVVARYPVDRARPFLTALLRGDWTGVALEARFAEQPAGGTEWGPKHERLDLTISSCSCGATNFVEAICHWGEAKGEGKVETHQRLVHSTAVSPNETAALRAATNAG